MTKWFPMHRANRRILVSIAVTAMLALIFTPLRAAAEQLLVRIDISEQRMTVSADGAQQYSWPVSTARPGYRTPLGTFHPQRLERMWYSTKYDYAPMPHSIFFYGGYAIHGTTDIGSLGRPVSHGCIRLHPDNAEILFNRVNKAGMRNTTIRIVR